MMNTGPSQTARAAALLLLACAAAACDAAESGGRVSMETLPGGTIVVTNPTRGAWTARTAWRAVEDLRIGRAEGAGPDVLAAPGALEVDAAGRLYVLDLQASRVRVFDPAGRHLRSFGGPGAGPGELTQPAGLALAANGDVWVLDAGNGRFVVFDSAGSPIATHRRESTVAWFPWPGRIDRAGRLWDVAQTSTGAPVLYRVDTPGAPAARFTLVAPPPARFTSRRGGVTNHAPVPYAPALAWVVDPDGRVWSGVSDEYRLTHHEPGGDTARIVRIEHHPVPVSAAERDSVPAMLAWFTSQGGKVDLGRVPRHKPAFTSVMTDDGGWLWVRPSLPAGETGTAWDVLDLEGRLQGRVTLPISVPEGMPVVVRGRHLYTVALAEAGYPQVVRFRLEGRSPGGTHVARR